MSSERHDGRWHMPPLEDPWECATPDGAEYEQLRRMAGMTFMERLRWLERARRFAALIRDGKRRDPSAERPSD